MNSTQGENNSASLLKLAPLYQLIPLEFAVKKGYLVAEQGELPRGAHLEGVVVNPLWGEGAKWVLKIILQALNTRLTKPMPMLYNPPAHGVVLFALCQKNGKKTIIPFPCMGSNATNS